MRASNRNHDNVSVELIQLPQRFAAETGNTGAFHSFSISTEFHVNLTDASTEMAEWTIGVRSLRSQGNIKVWPYLPHDCVHTMIKVGWDRTT
jgi:hypothetical protein